MEITTELVVAVIGVITGILGWLGKKKYQKMGEILIKSVNEYVGDKPKAKGDETDAYYERQRVKKMIKVVADLSGVSKKLDKFKDRVEKKIWKVIKH